MKKRIACAQMTAVNGDRAENLSRIEKLVKEAAQSKCHVVVFPELATVGYGEPEANAASAEAIPGPTSQTLSRMAKENKIAVAIGMPELDEVSGIRYNTMLLIGADGEEVFRYHKVHLWTREKAWAQPGEDFPVKEWESIPTGMWVCYDSRFPEAARSIALAGGKLSLVATAWLGPSDEWELAIRSRAMDNGIFVAASALQGEPFYGPSLIVDPH
ncbi:MAG: carbon-nitrogen hydrolase family protein, partial [Opitutaceae bacterium]|nr:carbon-nitrogen hydrolase family protein [Opitutaceae bacterium]